MEISLSTLADRTQAKLIPGDLGIDVVFGFADLISATPTEVTFFGNATYLKQLRKTQAGAVFVPLDFDEALPGPTQLRVENPSAAFAIAVDLLSPPPTPFQPGIHDAFVHPSAEVDPDQVCVCPGAVIGAGVKIGRGSTISSNVTVREDAVLGEDCYLHQGSCVRERCVLGNRVVLQPGAVIGSDGFGYEQVDGRHRKIEQRGIVQLDDDVEVGANATIDRARFGKTWIGEGTKIDNLVQVGHNVRMGKHCIVVALTGIAGSAVIGDYVTIAAQSGIAGHIEVGSRAVLSARTGVTKSIPGDQVYARYPAMPADKARKVFVYERRLEELYQRLRVLEGRRSS